MSRTGRARVWLASILVVAVGCAGHGPSRFLSQVERQASSGASSRVQLHRQQLLMGTLFQIRVVIDDEAFGQRAMEAAFQEVARVEEGISEWRQASDISAVNRAAGQHPVAVGADMLAVTERALAIGELTRGAFDVTFASCGHLWSFGAGHIPADEELRCCLAKVDYRRVELDRRKSTILLPDAGARLGVGGIGKGYGVDRAAAVLENHGIEDYLVDGGRDLRLRGGSARGPWRVGIAHPRRPNELFAVVSPGDSAVVTSGDYERYFQRDGRRYHHILDPTTGRPARRSVAVTVVAPDAMSADALATGLFVMGPEAGLELVESLASVEALFFGPDLEVLTSSGFPELEVVASSSPHPLTPSSPQAHMPPEPAR